MIFGEHLQKIRAKNAEISTKEQNSQIFFEFSEFIWEIYSFSRIFRNFRDFQNVVRKFTPIFDGIFPQFVNKILIPIEIFQNPLGLIGSVRVLRPLQRYAMPKEIYSAARHSALGLALLDHGRLLLFFFVFLLEWLLRLRELQLVAVHLAPAEREDIVRAVVVERVEGRVPAVELDADQAAVREEDGGRSDDVRLVQVDGFELCAFLNG